MSVSHAVTDVVTNTARQANLERVTALAAVFAQVKDPRKPKGVRHPLTAALTVLTMALLCGARDFRQAAQGWVLTCNIAADLTAWTRLLGLYDQPDLAHAEPDTLRYRLLHLPGRLATHARRRVLSIPETWPWADAFTLCWRRLTLLPPAT